MDLYKKYRLDLVILLSLAILFFSLRLPNLTLQPIFADEAIYIRWAQVMRAEPTLRFLPLSDGKTPFFMWTMMPFLKFIPDPLYAGRLLSILSGFATVIGLYLIGRIFFNRKVAFFSAVIATVCPMLIFFDRLALVDSMLAASFIWSLLFALLVVKYQRLDMAMILGGIMGTSILVKTPGFFNTITLPLTILAFDFSAKKRAAKWMKLAVLWLVAITMAMVIYNSLRLGPGFSSLSSRNQDYVHPFTRLLEYPLDPFIPHLKDIADWYPSMLTWPLLLLIILGAVLVVKQRNRLGIVLLLWSLLPLMVEMALLKTFTARYILFTIPPLLLLAGFALEQLHQKLKKYQSLVVLGLLLLFIAASLMFVIPLLNDPLKAPLPREERRGYLEDWTAGYGFPEIAEYIKTKAQTQKVIVGTEGYFGTLPDGLYIYLDKAANVSVIGSGATISPDIRNAAEDYLTFFVANRSRVSKDPEGTILIKQFPKALGPDLPQDAILLYQVLPREKN